MARVHAPARRWLVSPRFDLGWFVVPSALALLVALGLGLTLEPAEDDSLILWIVGVLLVDVAHVWASLYRTYLDPQARRLHSGLLKATPVIAIALAFIVHVLSARLFWGALAYVAVFHFIKQQEGFVALYLRASPRPDPTQTGESPPGETTLDRHLAKAAVWVSTAGPVIWWHSQLPRRFAWFMDGDFITGLPQIVGSLALGLQLPILVAFFARRIWLGRRGHPMVAVLVALTAASWNLGIVAFDDGRIFTITNVFIHGVPYMALVWITGGRERVQAWRTSKRGSPAVPERAVALLAAGFYGLLALLAFAEESLWDRLVWHEHAMLFGAGQLSLDEFGLALAVAVLSVPQTTHYVLDRYIWKVGPSNPELARQLGFATPAPR